MLRCLVVDDHRDGAIALGAFIRVLGADVRVVFSGHEAISLAPEFRPHLVILDLNMPELDGFETAKILKEQPWADVATFVAHSGAIKTLRPAVMAAGFHHFVVKGDSVKAFEAIVAGISRQVG